MSSAAAKMTAIVNADCVLTCDSLACKLSKVGIKPREWGLNPLRSKIAFEQHNTRPYFELMYIEVLHTKTKAKKRNSSNSKPIGTGETP